MAFEYSRRTAKIARYFDQVRGGARGAPISIQVALTDTCLNQCVMCDHHSRPSHTMDAAMWLAFLDALPVPPESICYSGGDPFTHRDFNDVMAWHLRSGVAFGTTVTGLVPGHIDLALLAHARWVRVSLDAITPSVYHSVRGGVNITEVIRGIDAMIAADVSVALGITVHKENEADIPAVLAFASERGITDVEMRPVYPDSIFGGETKGTVRPNVQCSSVLYQLYVDSDGAVYPCCITCGDTKGTAQSSSLGNIFLICGRMFGISV